MATAQACKAISLRVQAAILRVAADPSTDNKVYAINLARELEKMAADISDELAGDLRAEKLLLSTSKKQAKRYGPAYR